MLPTGISKIPTAVRCTKCYTWGALPMDTRTLEGQHNRIPRQGLSTSRTAAIAVKVEAN